MSRFNDFPIFQPKIGRKGKKKILLFDQSYDVNQFIYNENDNYKNFIKMLSVAKEENYDSDIIIYNFKKKTKKIKDKNVFVINEKISPISLIEMVDKVYVCDSYVGLFALMFNKEVHTFNAPFYSNWGLTVDDKIIERRKNKRTLEELVYIFFIIYTYYVDPIKKEKCDIETTIDYLLEMRNKFFLENKIRFDKY